MRVLLVSVNSHSSARTAPRKIPRQARSRATVDRILDAAARLFDAHGYRATTTNHVAEEAEVSVGSLYQYFPSKDALLTALAERHLDAAAPAARETAASLEPGALGPAELARLLIETSVALNPDSLHTLLRDAPHNDDVVDRFAAFRVEMSDVLATHLIALGPPRGSSVAAGPTRVRSRRPVQPWRDDRRARRRRRGDPDRRRGPRPGDLIRRQIPFAALVGDQR